MNRDALDRAGIHLPALPTLVLGGLPGHPDWAPRLQRLGLDVVSSGAQRDSDETLAAARRDAPYVALKASGADARLADGPWLVEGGSAPPGAHDIAADDVIRLADANDVDTDPNVLAATLLPLVRQEPARFWVAAYDLAECAEYEVEAVVSATIEATRLVRLFLIKQQFDLE